MSEFEPSRIGIFNIEPLGRASSVFFQGLFDGHPSVLTLPLGTLNHNSEQTPNSLWQGLECSINEYAPKVKLDRAEFMRAASSQLARHRSPLLALYRGYAAAAGKDIRLIRWLCYHAHSFETSRALLDEFPQLKFLFLIRDPRASFASMKKRKDLNPYLQHRRFLSIYRYMYKRLGSSAYLIRHEDIHLDFEVTLNGLRNYLGIDDAPSLRESSYFGNPYTGQKQSFGSTSGVFSSRPDPRYVTDEWRSVISQGELSYIEDSASDLIEECGYTIARGTATGTDFDYNRLLPTRQWPKIYNFLAGINDEMRVRLSCASIRQR